MRPPRHLLDSQFFQFNTLKDYLAALGDRSRINEELKRVEAIAALGLPPITSESALAVMLGINPGFVWSMRHSKAKHYRTFTIKKSGGKGVRNIMAPRVGLKLVQKWISCQLGAKSIFASHVFGFVPGKSHLLAAHQHIGAKWALELDIENFFPTTRFTTVKNSLVSLGYDELSADLIADICTLNGFLPQGSPASPVLSNLSFKTVDQELDNLARAFSIKLTRYADDIVFSGAAEFDPEIQNRAEKIIENTEWKLSANKTHYCVAPSRIKIHGLLVQEDRVRLTKGYRNKIRAYRHVLANHKIRIKTEDIAKLQGHLEYAKNVLSLDKFD